MTNDNPKKDQCCLCLLIDGIDLPSAGQKESTEDCLKKDKIDFVELGIEFPDDVVDYAHRIGKIINYKGKQSRQMIVKLATWCHRTMICRAMKNNQKYII